MINVLFIAYHFPPVGGAPVQRTSKFIKYLLHENYRAIVICGPTKSKEKFTPQDSKLSDEIPSVIPIYRAETAEPRERKGIFHKLQNLLMRPRPFAKWWVHSARNLSLLAQKKHAISMIYATMSPFESAEVAFYLSQQLNLPWVADLRDAWALDEIQTYPSLIHRKLMLKKMHDLLSTASLIIMNTPEATKQLKVRFPDFCDKRVITITNGFDSMDFREEITKSYNNKFRMVHVGHFLDTRERNSKRKILEAFGGAEKGVDTSTRSPKILLRALEKLSALDREIIESFEILFVGNMSDVEYSLIEASKLKNNCIFTGYLARSDALKIVRTADLLFLPMHNLPSGRKSTSIPSKMYEYMASGRPILAAVPDGDARDFLSQCGTAYLCRPDDCDGMMRNISEVYNSWSKGEGVKSANKEFLRCFERKRLTKILAREFDRVLVSR